MCTKKQNSNPNVNNTKDYAKVKVVNKAEVYSDSVLMKKTKADLIKIILRKDDADREKTKIIDEIKKDLATAKLDYSTLKQKVEEYKSKESNLSTINAKLVKESENTASSLVAAKQELSVGKKELDSLTIENKKLYETNNELQSALDDDAIEIASLKKSIKFWKKATISILLVLLFIVCLNFIL